MRTENEIRARIKELLCSNTLKDLYENRENYHNKMGEAKGLLWTINMTYSDFLEMLAEEEDLFNKIKEVKKNGCVIPKKEI